MLRILKRTVDNKRPRDRAVYGVTTGAWVGELLTYIRSDADEHKFLSMPKMLIRVVTQENFEYGIENNIIEFVEQLPRDVYRVVEAQFNHNIRNVQNADN